MTQIIFIAVLLGFIYFKVRSLKSGRNEGQHGGENFPFPSIPLTDSYDQPMPSMMPSSEGTLQRGAAQPGGIPLTGDLQYNQEGEYVTSLPDIKIPRSAAASTVESQLQPQIVEPISDTELTSQVGGFKAKDFDLRTAVIYREILDPKYNEY